MAEVKVLRKNLIVQAVVNGVIYGTEDHLVWASHDQGRTWREVCRLYPADNSLPGLLKDYVLRSPLVRRIRRNIGINDLVLLDSGTLIIQYDKIYRYTGQGRCALPVYDFRQQGIFGPLKNGLACDRRTGFLYFGEYRIKRPAAIRIVRGYDDGRRWEVCYEFPEGRIRHVHGIFPDPYRRRIWICTGDSDAESGLFYTDDDFKTVNLYGGGDQSWRMVSLLITKDHLIWGSDAGQDAPAHVKNYIYSLDLQTGIRKQLCCIDKPAYYGSTAFVDGSMCLATTFEPGIKRNLESSVELWLSRDGSDWSLAKAFHYRPAGRSIGTRYAMVIIPRLEQPVDGLCCSLLNVENFDFTAIKVLF